MAIASASRQTLRAVVFSSLLLAVAGPAGAQQQGAPGATSPAEKPSAAAARDAGIEEIVVTARKREERLQETPVSVTAFTLQDLEERGIKGVKELSDFTPNLKVQTNHGGNTGTTINLRGLSTTDPTLGLEPTVGVYVDGVYVAKSVGSLFDIIDLERAEVLRGPQGTLFGRNTIGGAVNLITAKPSSEFGVKFAASFADYDQYDQKLTVNVPLLDNLFARGTFARTRRDGFHDNSFGFADQDNDNSLAGRLALRWLPRDDLTVDLTVSRQRIREEPSGDLLSGMAAPTDPAFRQLFDTVIPAYRDPAGNPITSLVEPDGRRRIQNDGSPNGVGSSLGLQSDLDLLGSSATITWQRDDLTFKWISAYREFWNSDRTDLDGTAASAVLSCNVSFFISTFFIPGGTTDKSINGCLVPDGLEGTVVPFFSGRLRIRHNAWSHEFQVTGDELDGRLDWVAGLYYFREKGRQAANPVYITPVTLDLGPNSFEASTNQTFEIDNYQLAGYTQVSFDVTPALTLTGGARYTYERKEMDSLARTLITNVTILNVPGEESAHFTAWSPMADVAYRWTDDLMTYFRWARGFRSGGFNARSTSVAAFKDGFDDEELNSYEVGIKSRFFEDRLQLNLTGFYNEYDDLQVSQFDPGGGITSRLVNAGEAHFWGAEVEMIARPLPGLTLDFGFGFLDPTYDEFNDVDPATGAEIDVKDDRDFVNTPTYTFNAGVEYVFPPTPWGVVSARLDWYHQTDVDYLIVESQNRFISEGHYHLLNARLTLAEIDLSSLRELPGTLSLSAWVTNLTDKEYRDFGIGFDLPWVSYGINTYGDPRTFGLSLAYQFGGI